MSRLNCGGSGFSPARSSPQSFLRQALIPEAGTVPAEYWHVRGLDSINSLLGVVSMTLHDQAYFTAMGVGDPAASPLTAVIVIELAETVKCNVGLFLAAMFSSSLFSSHAKAVCVTECVIMRWFQVVRSLLYLTAWGRANVM